MTDFNTTYPKLRLVDTSPISYEGSEYLLLRDPLGLVDKTLLVPEPMIPALVLCDGTKSPSAMRATLAVRYGLYLTIQRIEEFLNALDDALLFDNERSRQARALAQEQFRRAPYREPASAGISYPDDPSALADYLQGYLNQLNGHAPTDRSLVRGVVSPHIDYERGGPIYAKVWSQAAASIRAADLVIIIGTDHFSEACRISLTRQNYATPFGVLPTDTGIVDSLAETIGVEEAFAGELHHRREHSIELAAVWMHYMRDMHPVQVVPILTGSLTTQGKDPHLTGFVKVLKQAMRSRRAVVVAAGDLAHVGPAFETEPALPPRLEALQQADQELIQAMCQGSVSDFTSAIEREKDQNNVCGVSPISLALRLLAPVKGQSHGYAVCPADENRTSVVTICGVTLY